MQKRIFLILPVIILFFLSINTFSQTYSDDSLAVRAILDSNGLYDISVDSVTDSSGGRIVVLDLDNQFDQFNITSLPPEIGNLTNLEKLNLWDNFLTSLPQEIGNLTNLRVLFLYRNYITSLPSNMGNLNNLRFLGLGGNSLTSLPSDIGNLTNLEILLLKNNSLTSLPDSIVNLKPFDWLDLGYNQLCSLSVDIKAWADRYGYGWESTQDCDNAIAFASHNKPQTYTILFNPKNSSINLYIPSSGNVKLEVFDIKGRLIATLIDSYKKAGKHYVNWGRHKHCSGIYYLKLSSDNSILIQRVVVAK